MLVELKWSLNSTDGTLAEPPGMGQLLALVDSLHEVTLNETQAETVRQLRAGILALAERESTIQDVKVPSPVD